MLGSALIPLQDLVPEVGPFFVQISPDGFFWDSRLPLFQPVASKIEGKRPQTCHAYSAFGPGFQAGFASKILGRAWLPVRSCANWLTGAFVSCYGPMMSWTLMKSSGISSAPWNRRLSTEAFLNRTFGKASKGFWSGNAPMGDKQRSWAHTFLVICNFIMRGICCCTILLTIPKSYVRPDLLCLKDGFNQLCRQRVFSHRPRMSAPSLKASRDLSAGLAGRDCWCGHRFVKTDAGTTAVTLLPVVCAMYQKYPKVIKHTHATCQQTWHIILENDQKIWRFI